MKRLAFTVILFSLLGCGRMPVPTQSEAQADRPPPAGTRLPNAFETPTLFPINATNTVAIATISAAGTEQAATARAQSLTPPAPATRTATITPSVTPTPGMAAFYDSQTTAEQKRLIETGLQLARKNFAQPVSVELYAFSATRAFCDAYALASRAADCDLLLEYSGFAFPGRILLNISSAEWQSNAPSAKVVVVIHEYVHIIQIHSAAGMIAPTARPDTGPNWLSEGSADWFAYQIAAKENLVDLARIRQQKVEVSRLVPGPLYAPLLPAQERIIESYRRYSLGYLATEYLSKNYGGDDRVLQFYSNIKTSPTWQIAFQNTFGITVDSFYDKFEEYRRVNFPILQQPK